MELPPVIYRKLGKEQAWGQVEVDDPPFEIEIDERLRGFSKNKYLIHEALHLALPELSELEVRRVSFFLARLQHRENLRFMEK